jgi:2-polyprenyl-3-methyl-5-hydroxy-6-metoxy-1,4-benzoquinol methylase
MKSSSKHWNKIFAKTEESKLGWYEKDASQTFKLLNHIPGWQKSTVFLPGAGTSILIDELLSSGVKLVLNDISTEALNQVKKKLTNEAGEVDYLCQDIAKPIQTRLRPVDIWIDRAVLHFLTAEDDIIGYFENLKSILKKGSYAIFAEFSLTGARKCAGLTLHRYSIEELSERLGSSFTLLSHFDYIYTNPGGDPRPYVYALYKREK